MELLVLFYFLTVRVNFLLNLAYFWIWVSINLYWSFFLFHQFIDTFWALSEFKVQVQKWSFLLLQILTFWHFHCWLSFTFLADGFLVNWFSILRKFDFILFQKVSHFMIWWSLLTKYVIFFKLWWFLYASEIYLFIAFDWNIKF